MTRRAARDEVGADSGTPQEGALAIAVWVKRMRERDDWPETDVALMDALDSLLAYIKRLEEERDELLGSVLAAVIELKSWLPSHSSEALRGTLEQAAALAARTEERTE